MLYYGLLSLKHILRLDSVEFVYVQYILREPLHHSLIPLTGSIARASCVVNRKL